MLKFLGFGKKKKDKARGKNPPPMHYQPGLGGHADPYSPYADPALAPAGGRQRTNTAHSSASFMQYSAAAAAEYSSSFYNNSAASSTRGGRPSSLMSLNSPRGSSDFSSPNSTAPGSPRSSAGAPPKSPGVPSPLSGNYHQQGGGPSLASSKSQMSLRGSHVAAGVQQQQLQQQQLRSALKHSPKHRPANPPDNLRPDSGIGSPAQPQQQQQQSGVTPLAPAEVVAHDVSKIRYCVGLDFGTTYSGFAIVQMQSDPTKLQPVTPLNWPDQPPNVTGVKTPTISCYAKDNLALDSWGFTAMKKNTMKVHKIERVKLCLEPSTPEFLKPIIPEGLQADDIIRDYLREVDGYCMQTLDRMWGVSFGKGDIAKDEIMYCLTVPVNWSAESHQRLRRAAYRAGLITTERSPNLVFCYEPEAACMACVHDPDVQLRPGSEFLVVDCGGGTVDLFQCRIGQTDDPRSAPELVELSMGQGGFFGATNVDVAFLNYLGELMTPLGLENVSHSPRCAAAWNNLLSQWEYRKRSFTGSEMTIDEIFVPQAILRELEDTLDGQLPEALEGGTIELDPQRMRSFFDPVLDSIIRLVQTQIHSLVTSGDPGATSRGALASSNGSGTVLEHMFVVGGFGNSAYLRKRIADDPVIKKLVNRVRSIPSPEVAVLRGAVYAAVGDSIRSRRARRSIGVQILRPFDPQVDDERDVVYRAPDQPRNQAFWLVDSYVETFILKGDPVQMSSHYAKHHFSLSPGSWTADINIFASDVRRPLLHTRRDKCDFLGRVTIDARPVHSPNSPSSGSFHGSARDSMVSVAPSTSSGVGSGANANWSKRDLSISIYFGRVELEVCVTDTESGRTWRTILGHGHIHVR